VHFYWQADAAGVGGPQSIHIYDLTGRKRATLDLGAGAGGVVQWNGRDDDGRRVPAGLYFARLLSGSVHVQTRWAFLP